MKMSVRTLILELLAAIVLLMLVAAGALAWRLSKGPLELDVFKSRLETAMTEARGGLPVTIEGLALEWSSDKRRVEAVARGITAFDGSGATQATAERGAVALDTVSIFRGKLQVARIRLENGVTALTRDSGGIWRLGSGQAPADQTSDLPAWTITDWRSVLPPLREAISQQSFERMDFSDFTINIRDEVADVDWVAHEAIGAWSADHNGVMIDVSADLTGESAPEAAQFTFYSDQSVAHFSFEIGVVGASPERLASFLAARDLPFKYEGLSDATFGGEASEADGLKSLQFSMAGENGVLFLADEPHALEAVSFEALLDMQTHLLTLTELNVQSDKVSGRFQASLDLSQRLASGSEQPVQNEIIPMTLGAQDATIDMTPMLERPFDIQSLDLTGELIAEDRKLVIDRLITQIDELRATGSGALWLEDRKVVVDDSDDVETTVVADSTKSTSQTMFAAQLELQGEGRVRADQVLQFWPVNLGASARGWVRDHVHGGEATSLDFKMDLRPEVYERGYLNDDSLKLEFSVREADVSFLSDLPHVTKASGKGVLRGNSIELDLSSGELGGWKLDGGSVKIPRFHPKGAETLVRAQGRGDLRQMMQILEDSRLKTASGLGIDLQVVEGYGGLDAEIRIQTNGKGSDDDEVAFAFDGGFVDATVPGLAGGFGLVRSDVRVACTNDGLKLQGSGRFGPAPVEFEWTERFGDDAQSVLETTAIVTPDFLNAFNIAARNFMNGEAEVQLRAVGSGRDFEEITADVDFTRSTLDLSEIGWFKRFNEPASGVIRYARDENGEAVGFGDIKAEGLALAGEVHFDVEDGFRRAVIDRIYAQDQMDLRGSLVRQPEGKFVADVSGPMFNAEPWMDALFKMGGDAGAREVQGADTTAFEARISVDSLQLRGESILRNASLAIDSSDGGVNSALVAGTISPGKGLEGTLETEGENKIIKLRADDAGFVVRNLTKSDYLRGGVLSLEGRFDSNGGETDLKMANVRLKEAPLAAQVFSLASLQGLTDVLNGDGVLFTEVEAPIRFSNGQMEISGGRASGPAMGLTLRGTLGLGDSSELGLDGVIVPSFGVNSALGGIPIIGDLFVSRQGEGVFAVVYSVRGSLERAKVAINPLSAVTPGFLRRIMENPSRQPEPTADDRTENTPAEDPPASP